MSNSTDLEDIDIELTPEEKEEVEYELRFEQQLRQAKSPEEIAATISEMGANEFARLLYATRDFEEES